MNKSVLSIAVLAALAVSGAAQAQTNVQVYGVMDAGLEYLNHATASQGSQTKVISGGKNTSRWGFRGTEELGGGLKAVFGLEGGILLDNGNADGPLFKRQAFVGLKGGFGQVILGRSFTTAYDFVLPFDPLGYAPHYSWATSTNASGPSKYGMTTAFDNLVKYSGQTGDFKYGATVGLGEQASGSADGRKYAVGTMWDHAGLGLMATYEQINGNLVAATARHDETRTYHAGISYKTGPLKLLAATRGYKLESGKAATPDVRADTYWIGADYEIKPAVTLAAAVYHVNVKNVADGQDADPTMYVLRGIYALSKRTVLYAAAAYAKADNGKLVSLSRDDAGFASTQAGLTVGIQHRF
ncbi:MAG TPA: porin [Telluria sp.]|nr:porin [Telluria sp.]